MIKIENLVYAYPRAEDDEEVDVLKGINLTIEKGEFVTILGHNGSGKSTLAKILNAQIFPKSGKVYINGLDSSKDDIWEIRSKCGMVFQNPDNQMVATIVEEDVAFGAENLGVANPELRNRVNRSLEIVGMESYKKHAPHMLSGGQKQRVAIAGVLAMNPDIIIFDEPTAMLDPTGRRQIMDTAVRLNKEENKTILNITHYMDEAVLSDRIIVLNNGEIAMEGSPREVFSKVDEIKGLGLDVPQVTELAYLLNRAGINIRPDLLSIDELVDSL